MSFFFEHSLSPRTCCGVGFASVTPASAFSVTPACHPGLRSGTGSPYTKHITLSFPGHYLGGEPFDGTKLSMELKR